MPPAILARQRAGLWLICVSTGFRGHLGARLVEAEINPLFVLPAGLGVRAASGVAVLAEGNDWR